MANFTRSFDLMIDAPVHEVFEYCRDPAHLFEGWRALEVTDVVMTPEGVGTTAHIVGRFAKGMMVEQVEREYTEVVPDARIVTRAHGTARFAGRTRELASLPVFSWLFEAEDGGTKLVFVVEEDLAWWQRMLAPVNALAMSKSLHSMLAAIKTGVERQASPPA